MSDGWSPGMKSMQANTVAAVLGGVFFGMLLAGPVGVVVGIVIGVSATSEGTYGDD